MASYNPSDIQFSVIAESTPGTTPATGALLRIDHTPGTSPSYTSDVITSPVLAPKRAARGTRKAGFRAEGGLKAHFCRDAAIDLLLESAFAGSFATDVLKAGDVDKSFTIEKKMGGAAPLYVHFTGCQVSKFSLDVEAAGIADASFDVMGMGQTQGTTATALTYTPAGDSTKITGLDVTDISVGSLTGLSYTALNLTVESTKEAHSAFGSANAIAIGTSGSRKVTGSLTVYRKDFAIDTALAGDTPVAISFTVGIDGESYTFSIPSANAATPADEESGSKMLVKIDFTGAWNETAGTDISVTRD